MSARVEEAIVSAIGYRGSISFATFMELALYAPGGYYENPPIGADGDFVTNPHVHQVFGELVGAAIRASHQALGAPSPMRLAEVGAGEGTLARGLLARVVVARDLLREVDVRLFGADPPSLDRVEEDAPIALRLLRVRKRKFHNRLIKSITPAHIPRQHRRIARPRMGARQPPTQEARSGEALATIVAGIESRRAASAASSAVEGIRLVLKAL
jgi:hypothetical protein